VALFVNGAQGTMDIDGLRDRDWPGVERAGQALAGAVRDALARIVPSPSTIIRGALVRYSLPRRQITEREWAWAQEILARTGGAVQSVADGVGDDWKAVHYRDLRGMQDQPLEVEQTCFAVNGAAFLSFPGELYTEIGMRIKSESPFRHTYILGLANGQVGYVATRKAIAEGGYAEDTRQLDAATEDVVVAQSLALLRTVYSNTRKG
jgi:hypothetical protein